MVAGSALQNGSELSWYSEVPMLIQLAAAYDSKYRLVRQSDATHSVLGKADSVSEEMHMLEHCKALCYR